MTSILVARAQAANTDDKMAMKGLKQIINSDGVISETQKEECKYCETIIDKTERIQEPTKRVPNFCEIQPRYRRPTDECFDHDPLEDASKCAGSLTHPVSYLVTGLVAIATSILILR